MRVGMLIFKKEKEVIALLKKHIDKVKECLNTSGTTMLAYLDGDMALAKQLARTTDKLESEADLLRYQIRQMMHQGAYLPILREDIYKLVESVDDIANASEKCTDFFLNQRPDIPGELVLDFKTIINTSLSIFLPLQKALRCYVEGECSIKSSRAISREVGLIESQVDKLDWDLTKKIFSSQMDHCRKMHLKQCLETIALISDSSEDTAEQLEVVALKTAN